MTVLSVRRDDVCESERCIICRNYFPQEQRAPYGYITVVWVCIRCPRKLAWVSSPEQLNLYAVQHIIEKHTIDERSAVEPTPQVAADVPYSRISDYIKITGVV